MAAATASAVRERSIELLLPRLIATSIRAAAHAPHTKAHAPLIAPRAHRRGQRRQERAARQRPPTRSVPPQLVRQKSRSLVPDSLTSVVRAAMPARSVASDDGRQVILAATAAAVLR